MPSPEPITSLEDAANKVVELAQTFGSSGIELDRIYMGFWHGVAATLYSLFGPLDEPPRYLVQTDDVDRCYVELKRHIDHMEKLVRRKSAEEN
jgi:hypothetical protein